LGLLLCRFFFCDAAFYFCLFWLPKYLFDARGFDTRSVGYFAWIPYLAHAMGGLSGGWFSSRFMRWGYSLNFSRKAVIGFSALLAPALFYVTRSPVSVAIVLLSIAYFGQAASSAIIMVLPADLFPAGNVGTVSGMIGFGGALGGSAFGFVVAYLLDHGFGYPTVFALVSTFPLLAFFTILATIPAIGGLDRKTPQALACGSMS
jgi:ACS family hexuronate transporter-like MFS transporter